MKDALPTTALEQIFTKARTHHAWLDKPVSDQLIHSIYELAEFGPTSVNCVPMRIVFVKSKAEKEKLLPCLGGSNVDQVKSAPVTAILAYDEQFYQQLPTLFPAFDAKSMFTSNSALAHTTAFRNSSMQGGYFILAVRALGLDAGPMSGFDNEKVDQAFFKDMKWKSNFLCNIGYGDDSKLYPRGPRLNFDEACKIV